MIPQKYLVRLRNIIRQHFPTDKSKIFIFGSSIKYKQFWDIDVGLMGSVEDQAIADLSEALEKSTFPYMVDLKNFNTIDPDFANSVLHHQKIKWI